MEVFIFISCKDCRYKDAEITPLVRDLNSILFHL